MNSVGCEWPRPVGWTRSLLSAFPIQRLGAMSGAKWGAPAIYLYAINRPSASLILATGANQVFNPSLFWRSRCYEACVRLIGERIAPLTGPERGAIEKLAGCVLHGGISTALTRKRQRNPRRRWMSIHRGRLRPCGRSQRASPSPGSRRRNDLVSRG